MDNTINVLPDGWLTTEETATALRVSLRTVQKMGKDGRLKRKLASNSKNPSAYVYDSKEVQRHMPTTSKPAPGRSHHKREDQSVAKRGEAIENRVGHALETINIVGQMLAAQKAERDAEREQIAATQAAEMEKLKWEREDARERFEAEQKRLEAERLERLAEQRRAEEPILPWITLETAVAISGRTRRNLVELCTEGKIVAEKAGGWRILRRSLEALDQSALGPVGLRKAASAK